MKEDTQRNTRKEIEGNERKEEKMSQRERGGGGTVLVTLHDLVAETAGDEGTASLQGTR